MPRWGQNSKWEIEAFGILHSDIPKILKKRKGKAKGMIGTFVKLIIKYKAKWKRV